MKRTKNKWSPLTALALASAACATTGQTQTSDALLNKLIDKGILTTKEVEELKKEAKGDFDKAYHAQTGLPDWVTSLKFSADFRARYEGHFGENDAFVQRDRFRYRIRPGVVATLKDDFEIGLRLSSGDPVSGFGNNAGNPLSGSSTLQDNGTRKFVYIDLAYAKWNPIHTAEWSGGLTFGKMENPFAVSQVMFDPDYNPEGLAAQLAYRFDEHHTLKANVGGFVLDELSTDSNDPSLLGGQLLLDSQWTKQWSSSVGVSIFSIQNKETLINANVPNVNRGNTRDATTAPTYHFNPIVGDASLTYTLDHFPGYAGAFPIRLLGEYLNNPAAPNANEAFMGGLVFGKAGKKGTWEASYQYRYIGADSWYEELPDDDFGAFYEMQQPNAGFTGAGAGFGGGTNLRGHVARLSYSPLNSLTLGIIWYQGELLHPNPKGSESTSSHVLIDAILKF
jgi:hypothetical protein